jgi:hypothetical protein
MVGSPAAANVDGDGSDRHDGQRTGEDDEQDFQPKNAEKFVVVEHGENGRHEEEKHVAQKPISATAQAADAYLPAREQGQDDQHSDNAAGNREAG